MTNSGISQWVLGYTAEPKCVDVDLDKNLYVQGNYTSSWADVDPTNGILNLPNNGNGEVYTIKLNQCVPTNSTINIDECDSYTSPNGSVLTVSGQYIDTIQNVGGCDSVITINLIVTPSYLLTESTTICKGEDYTFPDGTIAYNIIDTLNHTSYLTSTESCDSIINTIVYIEILDASISLMDGDGCRLGELSEDLRKDREVVMDAVQNCRAALEHAHKTLQEDEEIVSVAVSNDGAAMQFASSSIQNNKDFLLQVAQDNGTALEFVNEKFKKDKDIALAAVESVGEDAMGLIDESLRKDEDILNALSQHDY